MNNESITKTAQTTTTSLRKVYNNNNIRNLKERNFASSDFPSFTVAASADRTKVICFAGG
jgi:hypothetical protein